MIAWKLRFACAARLVVASHQIQLKHRIQMAIANINTLDSDGMVAHELEVGQVYLARAGGYGIIVIEDTMTPIKEKPLDTFPDNDLVIVMNPLNLYEVAPSHQSPLAATTAFHPTLTLRPVQLPNRAIHILVGIPS